MHTKAVKAYKIKIWRKWVCAYTSLNICNAFLLAIFIHEKLFISDKTVPIITKASKMYANHHGFSKIQVKKRRSVVEQVMWTKFDQGNAETNILSYKGIWLFATYFGVIKTWCLKTKGKYKRTLCDQL